MIHASFPGSALRRERYVSGRARALRSVGKNAQAGEFAGCRSSGIGRANGEPLAVRPRAGAWMPGRLRVAAHSPNRHPACALPLQPRQKQKRNRSRRRASPGNGGRMLRLRSQRVWRGPQPQCVPRRGTSIVSVAELIVAEVVNTFASRRPVSAEGRLNRAFVLALPIRTSQQCLEKPGS
ncbi:hypothetical protein Enr13x_63320 [Stieleria neptunia]|uniref:Uncharacterized protein n=1 Tax=Stieleria neptunia TaxID=2527979 RepID=A0A518HZZ3_9BACT|nr:hypothetical protein Enr13x_63320 [Stieleria neptunia]